ncbi:glycine betaine ABC transporter substrate-binding protein [Roseovarius indicus]|uniref:Amino acid-binding protein n=1 Tax=Roseovarius indicus TaxID=540747 RepID=A0A0T5P9V9_9RHOB|nr:glycine betaine ABC transporter substrate-binding protein [Roseovarius indicus]KRS17885.1 amino acid-binding protein [Roseovarius indicus]QEW27306.1 Glycine betaine-binding periplasmic protein precursor [Roseovarius indicus]SFD50562.1 glycine betaine/proline transport system substrate-binding protein [Roseovarius indicus]
MKKLSALMGGTALMVAGPAMAADIVIGVPNWPSVNATAHILKVAIEQNLGLEVELQNGTNPIVFEAMDTGAMHVHPEVWMPNQQNLHDTYVKDKGTVVMNPNGVEAFQGMCVDKATADANGITAIEDLTNPDIASLFDSDGDGEGELWIGAPGWASTNVEKIRAKSYGYDQTFELTEIDETVAYANLDNAIKAGDPWVGFCYTPHYVFELHDLQILEEPDYDPEKWTVIQPTDDPDWLEKSDAGVAWDLAYLHVHYAKELEDSYPSVATLLGNVDLTTDQVSAMTYALVIDGIEPMAYAEQWVADNEDAVLTWMTE